MVSMLDIAPDEGFSSEGNFFFISLLEDTPLSISRYLYFLIYYFPTLQALFSRLAYFGCHQDFPER